MTWELLSASMIPVNMLTSNNLTTFGLIFLYIASTIVVFILTWKTFDWFSWSRSASYHTSPWTHFKKRFGASLVNAILIPLVISWVYVQSKLPPNGEATQTQETPSTEAQAQTAVKTPAIDRSNNERIIEPVKSAETPFSADDVSALEDKAGYHGDDPIIRARLGLPPK